MVEARGWTWDRRINNHQVKEFQLDYEALGLLGGVCYRDLNATSVFPEGRPRYLRPGGNAPRHFHQGSGVSCRVGVRTRRDLYGIGRPARGTTAHRSRSRVRPDWMPRGWCRRRDLLT